MVSVIICQVAISRVKIAVNHHYSEGIIMRVVLYRSGKSTFGKGNFLCYGENIRDHDTDFIPGDHAEVNAVKKLKRRKNTKKLVGIDVLVVRLNRSGKLSNSKPCRDCIEKLKILPQKVGYYVNNIYYSDNNGDIIKTNIKKLENGELHQTSFFNWCERGHVDI
jgi:hypothetical protein